MLFQAEPIPPWSYIPRQIDGRRAGLMTHKCERCGAARHNNSNLVATTGDGQMGAAECIGWFHVEEELEECRRIHKRGADPSQASGWCLRRRAGLVEVPVRPHALDCIVRAEQQMNRMSRTAQGDAEFVTVARYTHTTNTHLDRLRRSPVPRALGETRDPA